MLVQRAFDCPSNGARQSGKQPIVARHQCHIWRPAPFAVAQRKGEFDPAGAAADHRDTLSVVTPLQPLDKAADRPDVEKARVVSEDIARASDAAGVDRDDVEGDAITRIGHHPARFGIDCSARCQHQRGPCPLRQCSDIDQPLVPIILARNPPRHRSRIAQVAMRRQESGALARQAVADPVRQHGDMRVTAADQQEVAPGWLVCAQVFCLPSISLSTSDGSASVEVSPSEP